MNQTLNTWLIALLLALMLSTSYLLDGPSGHNDYAAAQAQVLALRDAQRQEDATLRRDLAAAKMCRLEHGESSYTWTASNELVCLPRKGRAVLVAAKGKP